MRPPTVRLVKTLRKFPMPIALAGLLLAATVACASKGPADDPVVADVPDDLAHPARLWEGAFESGGARMNAIAYVATGDEPHPTVILLHGFPGNERNLDLAQSLRRGGWNVVFFHYRGAWGSGGDFGFVHALEDVEAVIAQVRSPAWTKAHHGDPDRVSLVGHSMGGFMALAATAEVPVVRCAVGVAAANLAGRTPDDPEGPVARETARRLDALLRGKLAGTSGRALVAELVAERDRLDLMRHVPALVDRPVLLVAGSRDRVVEIYDQKVLADALQTAGGSAQLVILDADHAFSSKRVTLGEQVLGFLDRHCR